MTMQICPKCHQCAFTWSIDEEASPLTQWYCQSCRYNAEEDETAESDCPACGSKGSCSLLFEAAAGLYYCFSCGAIRRASARETELARDVAAIRISSKEIADGKYQDVNTAFDAIRKKLLAMKAAKQASGS